MLPICLRLGDLVQKLYRHFNHIAVRSFILSGHANKIKDLGKQYSKIYPYEVSRVPRVRVG
jgi:hypothetical protein